MKCFISHSLVFFLLLHLEELRALEHDRLQQAHVNRPRKAQPAVIPSSARQQNFRLSSTYYIKTCPNLEAIVHQKLKVWLRKDHTLAASLIRLHFHDCAVRGCDGSILLNHRGSERSAFNSRTLRGFNVIDDIKAEIEKQCPRTVSCADILTTSARDATVMAGGPFWEVPFGRKDGRSSYAHEADTIVPNGHENVTTLINFFVARGLTELDLVMLSGAHTIGKSSCNSIRHRFSEVTNSSMDIRYLSIFKRICGPKGHNDHQLKINLDVTTPRTFDAMYYTNLLKRRGLLSTDQSLYSDNRTTHFVEALASQPSLFFNQFAVSMVKLGNIQVVTEPRQGEIRHNCNYVNTS